MAACTIELSAGPIAFQDTGGAGPVVVLLHGLLMDRSLWDAVVANLAEDCRCITPTLPLGAHRHPLRADADRSLPAIARVVDELLERLHVDGATLVGNDTGGALVQLLAAENPERVERIVLASCDAFDNFPAGLTGKTLVLCGWLPAPLFGAFMQQLRLRLFRRLPIAFGWLTKQGDAATRAWIDPVLHERAIRQDTVRLLRDISRHPTLMLSAAERLRRFERPALVVWAREDRVMPRTHGQRLADLLPHGQLVEIDDSYTLIPLDQPTVLANLIRQFICDPILIGAER